ncbi:hypothetical protein ACPV5S_15785 [Vibrio astriarenae]
MGLDQYWWSVDPEKHDEIEAMDDYEVNKRRENGEEITDHRTMFADHRKVPALNEFMAQAWADETGRDACDFNCMDFVVTEELLDELEERIDDRSLNENASGFFWGSHIADDYPEMKEAVVIARAKMAEGQRVLYGCWW